ncbi:MAG: M56 family metallopeptidase [Planctomycetota bacterium]|nr:M56 family metallopeptidase [Planctomycetota bacterium]
MNIWMQITSRLAWVLFAASIKSGIVLAAAAGLSLMIRRASAAARHLVWTIALVAAVLVPVLTLALPQWRINVLPGGTFTSLAFSPVETGAPVAATNNNRKIAGKTDEEVGGNRLPNLITEGFPSAVIKHTPSDTVKISKASAATGERASRGSGTNSTQLWICAAMAAWLCGAIAVWGTWVLGAIAIRRAGRKAVAAPDGPLLALRDRLCDELRFSRKARVLISDSAAMPVTWGVIAPRILLPRDAGSWPADQARSVLLHELAHVRRLDCATQFLGLMACAIYWFNPLVWLAAHRLRIERERACDDVVLNHGAAAEIYAEQLVLVARTLRWAHLASRAAIAMARPSQLRGRVVAILDDSINRRGMTRRVAIIAVILGAMGTIPLSAIHLGVRPPNVGAAETGPTLPTTPPAPATLPAQLPLAGADQHVVGRVADDAGQPVGGAHVVVWALKNGRSFKQTVVSNPDGSWSCGNIPGECKTVETGVWDLRYDTGPYYALNETSISKLQDGKFTLTVIRGVPIEGTVLGLDGKPAVGALVLPGPDRMPSNKIPSEKTDAAGHFSLAANPGEEVVITFSYKGCANEIIQFVMTEKKYEPTVQLTVGKTMRVRVVDGKGKPIAGAAVYTDTWRGHRTLTAEFDTDADGRFTWAEAPTDTVFCDVAAAGFVRTQNVPFAFDHDNVATLHAAVHVSGTVVDAQTGKPIEKFKIIPGNAPGVGTQPSWDTVNSWAGTAGKIDFSEEWNQPGYAVRIDADGYRPVESRVFTPDEAEVKLDFKLSRGKDITATILAPNGVPAAGAIALLALAGQNAMTINGEPWKQNTPDATADGEGRIHFPPQAGPFLLAAFSSDGYATADSDGLAKSNEIRLAPWGRVTGKLMIGSHPGANQRISISMEADQTEFDQKKPYVFHQLDGTTAADGTFTFNRVPAGNLSVSRTVGVPVGNSATMFFNSQTLTTTARPGETTSVVLGGMGRSVAGKVEIPRQFANLQDWQFGDCLATVEGPPEPVFPREIEVGTREQKVRWYNDFLKSDAGKAYMQARATARSYPLEISRDGAFRIEDVAAGSYTFTVSITRFTADGARGPDSTLARAAGKFTVPVMASGRSDELLKLPDLPLEVVEAQKK